MPLYAGLGRSLSPRQLLAALAAGWAVACAFPEYTLEQTPGQAPPSALNRICTDGLPSDAETDIDCGGGCSPCHEGKRCELPTDCVTASCVEGACRPATCDDGIKNGGETDRDCGGQCERACGAGDDCGAPADCQSAVCGAGTCQVPSCSDQARNGDETGVDCGGTCPACGIGMACQVNDDCASERCSELLCVTPQCTDGVVNGAETGADCGGDQCGPCPSGESCGKASDCMSLICNGSLLCVDAACDDQIVNGAESDLDCGGGICGGCAELQICKTAADCAGGACQSALCVPAMQTGMPLSRQGWTARASSTHPNDTTADVFDGELHDYWSNAALQEPGMYFEVDLGQVHTFFSVDFECPVETDAVGTFDIYFSSSGELGEPARRDIAGFPQTSVEFATAQVARYIRIELSAAKSDWWCISEFYVYQ